MQKMTKLALINGKVQTMDADCSYAEAVLVCGGYIEAIGSTKEISAQVGEGASVIDLQGRALYPGFIDTHSHLSMYAMYTDKVYCGAEVGNLAGALDRLKSRVDTAAPGELVVGWGFDDSILPEGRGPTRQELDEIAPDNPLLLVHISTHVSYVNSRSLELLGYTAATKIEGGEIVLDASGEPNGTLLEVPAFESLNLIPPVSDADFRKFLKQAMQDYNANGFTASHEAGIGLGGIKAETYLRILQAMERDGELSVGMYLSMLPPMFTHVQALGLMPGFGSDMLRLGGPKVFNDGSIQMNTAALLSPYHNRPDYKGSLITPAEEMMETLVQYHCDGFQIAYHGNGDAGIECMIQAMEKAQKICPRSEPRHILIHCQTASDSQIERMQKVGIVPSFFGLHVWYYGDRHRDIYLGPERAARINPSGTAVRLGMKHSLHADTPVLPPLTIRSISTAVNRITYDGKELGPEQRISIEEAVRAYTSHAAWFHFEEKRRGSIEVGKRADFVLLSQDLLAVKPEDILQTEVLMTMVGGRIVYDKR